LQIKVLESLLTQHAYYSTHTLLIQYSTMCNHNESLANQTFITTESHHAGETFMLAPLLLPWPRSAPHFFYSRISTVSTPLYSQLILRIYAAMNGLGGGAKNWAGAPKDACMHASKIQLNQAS